MKRILRNPYLYLLLALIFLNGCAMLPGIAERNNEVNKFIGKTELDLVRHYGQPIDVRYDVEGRKIFTFEWRYEETINEPARLYTDSNRHVTKYQGAYTKTERHLERRIYTIDRNGKVIKGRWKSY